jgi:hypothetical protein
MPMTDRFAQKRSFAEAPLLNHAVERFFGGSIDPFPDFCPSPPTTCRALMNWADVPVSSFSHDETWRVEWLRRA